MRKSQSVLNVAHLEDESVETATAVASVPSPLTEDRPGRSLLFVLDMDHTMVLKTLQDDSAVILIY